MSDVFTNEDRADSVDDLVRRFARDMGLDIRPEADGPVETASDLISNILHWVERASGNGHADAMAAGAAAIGQFVQETNIDYGSEAFDDLGPAAVVTVSVTYAAQVWHVEDGKFEIQQNLPAPR